MTRPSLALLAAISALCGCASTLPKPDDHDRVIAPCATPTTEGGLKASGHAFAFGPGGNSGRVHGAVVRSVEHPERCTITGEDGSFTLAGFREGEPVTLRMDKRGFTPIQTGTLAMPAGGIEKLTFQAPIWEIYHVMAMTTKKRTVPGRCQVATTVTRPGVSMYDADPSHGEAGATVTMAPAPHDTEGPIYFQYISESIILPDPDLKQTTRDGGVLYRNVPPGDYVMTAHKEGTTIMQVKVRCLEGGATLVNASPPWGLQVQAPAR